MTHELPAHISVCLCAQQACLTGSVVGMFSECGPRS
jgi:hypothetical protein